MITVCDRQSLIMWREGILLRNENGHLMVCDERAARLSEEALERGEQVVLTVDNRAFSIIEPIDGEYVERLL